MYFVFIAFLLLFIVIGAMSVFQSRSSTEDYLTASKSIPPWLAGLSAIATNNSGYMFIGMIGLTYSTGLSSAWLMIGWLIGDVCVNLLFVRKIRLACDSGEVKSFGDVISNWYGKNYSWLRIVSGVITVSFLTVYAAAQFKAGSKATQVMFEWSPNTGVWVGAVIVLVYCAAGGIRASIWTDAAQSIVMIIGMSMIMIAGIVKLGGFASAYEQMAAVSDTFMTVPPRPSLTGSVLFVVGWFFGGACVMGQPHIVVRFITLRDTKDINVMRFYYYGWFTVFYCVTIVVGLLSRVLLADAKMFDAELALPEITMLLLPKPLVGAILAALFAATMSTADSLIIACTTAVSFDIFANRKNLIITKFTTFLIVAVAIFIAISGNQTVFWLVLDAWGMLGSAFIPLLFAKTFGLKCGQFKAIAVSLAGLFAFILWSRSGLNDTLYAAAPGILTGILVFIILTYSDKIFYRKPHSKI